MSSTTKVTFHTCIDKEVYDLKWVIRDYSLILSNESHKTTSPAFGAGADSRKKFRLELEVFEVPHRNYTITKINLVVEASDIDPSLLFKIKYNLRFYRNDVTVHETKENDSFKGKSKYEIFKMDSDIMDGFISADDTLIIGCELAITSEDQKNTVKYESDDTNPMLVPKLNFDWIYLDEDLSDVKLRTACGKEIPAHKIVLAAASPVFKAMFSHDMKEKKSQSVDMIDVSHEAAVDMLRYIYVGEVEARDFSLTSELLKAAEKYQLEELKNQCERMLVLNLSTENAIEALKMADTYSAKNLERLAVEFIKRKINETLSLEEIKDMLINTTL